MQPHFSGIDDVTIEPESEANLWSDHTLLLLLPSPEKASKVSKEDRCESVTLWALGNPFLRLFSQLKSQNV